MGGHPADNMPHFGLTADSTPALNALSAELDRTYRAVTARLPDNLAARFETVGDKSEPILSPFDKLDEPTSLIELHKKVDSNMIVLVEHHLHRGCIESTAGGRIPSEG
jgi:hypothetical protein